MMRKINYIYYIVMLALWPAVDRLLSIGTRISPLFFWLLPLYAGWFIGSPFLLYWLRQRLPLRTSFHASRECKMEWGTFWLDEKGGELAALFILNPFHVQYMAVPRIDSMDVRLDGLTADRKYARQISVHLVVDGKAYKMQACSMGRFGPVVTHPTVAKRHGIMFSRQGCRAIHNKMGEMDMKRLLIWGAGDQGTVTLDCALAMRQYDGIGFLDMKEKGHREIPGYHIHEEAKVDLKHFLQSYDEVIAAVGSNELREKKINQVKAWGIPLAAIVHPTAIISPSASISQGCTVLARAVINPNARIGIGCIINTGAIVEHDCVVEDFVNICPGVSMAGHTRIGRKSFIGIGSTVIDDIRVGKEVVIGAGAAVIRDIPDYAVAVGVPAKVR